MDSMVTRMEHTKVAFPSWARITPIVRSALVCGVLALALVSILCLGAGLPVIPRWIQGLFSMGGVAVGTAIGVVRGPAA
jgi:hypothetical protein